MIDKKILVTGAAGFIGRRLIAKRLNSNLVVGNVLDYNTILKLVKKTGSVIHLAAGSSFIMYEENPQTETCNTVIGFLNILEAMKESSVNKIVYASTSAVYEGNKSPWSENMILNPPDLKSISKYANELMANEYAKRYKIDAIGLRPFNPYGVGEISKNHFASTQSLFLWAMLAGKNPIIFGDGTQERDFIYIDDVITAFIKALGIKGADQYNIGTGIGTSLNTLVKIIDKHLDANLKPKYVPIPIPIYADKIVADTKKSVEYLGFSAKIKLEDGIKKMVNELKEIIKSKPHLSDCQNYNFNKLLHRT